MKPFVCHDIEMLSFDRLGSIDNICSFTTTRQGGVSQESYGSFNLGIYAGDQVENVLENRRRLCRALAVEPHRLLLPYQTHGAEIACIDDTFEQLPPSGKTEYLKGKDAIMTNLPEYCIGVTTADCVPILLYDPICKAAAAIHAGWRGTVARIVRKCVAQMQQEYGSNPGNLLAAIGPAIGPEQFEIGDEVAETFRTSGFPLEQIAQKRPGSGKYHINLWQANRLELLAAGVGSEQIELAGICTRTHHDRFFSARKLGTASGRFVTGILLKPDHQT